MSQADRLADHLRQMADGSRNAMTFTDDMDREGFLADLRTQRAVVMSLMIASEAAARIAVEYPGFTEAYPDVPWRSIRDMRIGSPTAISTSIRASSGDGADRAAGLGGTAGVRSRPMSQRDSRLWPVRRRP